MEVGVEQVTFRCACCRRIVRRNSRVKLQHYCGAQACQQARKNKWQREKLTTDPDYRANKRESQQNWQKANPAYWRKYRSRHPEYQRHNQRLQQARDHKRSQTTADHLAKKDTLSQYFNDTSTTYYIYAGGENLAKKDALSVKIIPITTR